MTKPCPDAVEADPLLLEVLNFINKVSSLEIIVSGRRNEQAEREILRREAAALYKKLDAAKWGTINRQPAPQLATAPTFTATAESGESQRAGAAGINNTAGVGAVAPMTDAELERDDVLAAIESAEFVTRGLGFPHGGMQAVGYANYAVLKIPGRSQLHARRWFERFKEELAKKYRG